MFLFPYTRIKQNSKIILYGAGKVGRDYFMQIMGTNFCELIIWVDNNFEEHQKEYLPVYPIECMKNADYDYVVIAIQKKEIAEQVEQTLISKGVLRKKIVWNGNNKNYEFWNAQEEKKKQQEKSLYNKCNREGHSGIFWILNTPEHGNMGDHAIALAEKKFLSDFFPERKVMSVSGKEIDEYFSELKEIISSEDVLFITGGGYMGTLWEEEDSRVHKLLETFQNNKIVFFPQTFYYGNNQSKIESDKIFYQNRDNLLFFHREKNSYNQFIKIVIGNNTNNECVPDMAFYLNEHRDEIRGGILLCLRSDKEAILSEKEREQIEQLALRHREIKKVDTVYDFTVKEEYAEGVLQHMLQLYCTSEVVITDRLHGMLFSYITGTPCIVFDNLTQKISGVYEWIKQSENIARINTMDDLKDALDVVWNKPYQEKVLHPMFCSIAKCIKQFIE